MVEAANLFRLDPTSILDIIKVFDCLDRHMDPSSLRHHHTYLLRMLDSQPKSKVIIEYEKYHNFMVVDDANHFRLDPTSI